MRTRRYSSDVLDSKKTLLGFQLISILILIGTMLGVGILELIIPDFFNYPYFKWSAPISDILRFWPLLTWGLIGSIGSSIGKEDHFNENEEIFIYDLITSILAGVWEEIGYRCFFICTGMISIVIGNWFFSTFLGFILGAICLVIAVAFLKEKNILIGIGLLALAGLFFWVTNLVDPVYWVYNHIIFPVLNFVSIGTLSPILYNGHEPLFVMGAILANAKFRDGHKYQGTFGLLNSWIGGFVLLYAMLTYGLLVAIIVHAIYDIFFAVSSYVSTEIKQRLR